jgi:hypothetical protein
MAGIAKSKQVRKIMSQFENDILKRIPDKHRDDLVPDLDALWP